MNNFDYAQSNSLLKKEIDGQTSSPNNTMPQSSTERISGWQHDLVNQHQRVRDQASFASGTPYQNQNANGIAAAARIDENNAAVVSIASSGCDTSYLHAAATAKNVIEKKKSKPIPAKKTNQSKFKAMAAMPNASELENNYTEQSEKKQKKVRSRKPRRIIPNEKEYIPEDEQPTAADIVGGRGGRSNHHPGNRPYWVRILESRAEYTNCRSDLDKSRIANGILMYVRQTLGGRFLNIDSKTKRWFILPDAVVLDKIKQALRDKYVPYWARDLKIEDKVHSSVPAPMRMTTKPMNDNSGSSTLASNSFKSSNPWGGATAAVSGNANVFPPAATLAALNAVRANAANISNSFANVNNPNSNSKNKLDFLFNSAGRRPSTQNHMIPTIDDILKYRIDQMPMFSAAAANVPGPNIAAATFANSSVPLQSPIGLSAYQSMIPTAMMASIGIPGAMGGIGIPCAMGGISTNLPNSGVTGDANHGFGVGGNPGAPALPTNTMGSFLPSIGILQSLDMKSLDSYMEHQVTGMPATAMAVGTQTFNAQNANSAKTIDMLKSLVGTSFGSSYSSSTMGTVMSSLSKSPMPNIGAPPPMRSNKTDWNAMYNRALSNHKT